MKKKFSNKPKPVIRIREKKAPNNEIVIKDKIETFDKKDYKKTLFLISSNTKNIKTNITSSLDTWIKNIGIDDNYLFLCDKTIEKKHYISNHKLDYSNHTSYSAENMKWFLTKKIGEIPNHYEKICFCTDTTYINIFNLNRKENSSHFGCVTKLLYPSIENLKKIRPDIDANSMKMYHAEAGFFLSIDIVKKISRRIELESEILEDRWDSMIAFIMYLLHIDLNNEERLFCFPHTMLDMSTEKIKESISHGYLKDYEKHNLHKLLIGK